MRDHAINPENVCFEITETAAIGNLIAASQFIDHLRQMGCKFALDDFGSGVSSFAYLKNLKIDIIKIDGYFVKNVLDGGINSAIVEAINHIGHVIGIKTIAEFVESDAILEKLRQIGVDYVQGFAVHATELLIDMPLDKVVNIGASKQVS